jgi:uncharacterized protein YjiS (DUF1127 family)
VVRGRSSGIFITGIKAIRFTDFSAGGNLSAQRKESPMSNRLLFANPARMPPPHAPVARGPAAWASLRSAWRRYRSRRHIAQLDSHMLKDIGVSFAEAEAEANKPLWRA